MRVIEVCNDPKKKKKTFTGVLAEICLFQDKYIQKVFIACPRTPELRNNGLVLRLVDGWVGVIQPIVSEAAFANA